MRNLVTVMNVGNKAIPVNGRYVYPLEVVVVTEGAFAEAVLANPGRLEDMGSHRGQPLPIMNVEVDDGVVADDGGSVDRRRAGAKRRA